MATSSRSTRWPSRTTTDAVAAYKQALAVVAQDKAAGESAAINLGYTRVTAPISGRIGRSLVDAGRAGAGGARRRRWPRSRRWTRSMWTSSQSADQLLSLKRAMQGGRLAGGGPASVRVRLMLQDGTPYAQEGVLRFSEVTVDQTTGSVTPARCVPQSRPPAAARTLRARGDRRGRRSRRHPRPPARRQPRREGPSRRLRDRRRRQGRTAPDHHRAGDRRRLARHQRAEARGPADHRGADEGEARRAGEARGLQPARRGRRHLTPAAAARCARRPSRQGRGVGARARPPSTPSAPQG